MLTHRTPEDILDTAVNALSSTRDWRGVLDQLPVPIYTTDAEGGVTYWNSACIALAGREPQLGHDRWCVTWQLYTMTGERLPHEQCPMAQAIRQARPIRDAVAIAERPDGSRVAFKPYPTPLFDKDGRLTGAVNMLIDITNAQAAMLHEQADRCRRLAGALYSRESNTVLQRMAESYEQTAAKLEGDNDA